LGCHNHGNVITDPVHVSRARDERLGRGHRARGGHLISPQASSAQRIVRKRRGRRQDAGSANTGPHVGGARMGTWRGFRVGAAATQHEQDEQCRTNERSDLDVYPSPSPREQPYWQGLIEALLGTLSAGRRFAPSGITPVKQAQEAAAPLGSCPHQDTRFERGRQ
jgi:hypothetical protein